MGNATFNLTTDSYWAQNSTGVVNWTISPTNGLSVVGNPNGRTFTFTPSASTAGVYSVTAKASLYPAATTNFTVRIFTPVVEPIDVFPNDPAGLAHSDTGTYRIELLPAGIIPDGDITWTNSNSLVSFAGGNTGRSVSVQAGSTSGDSALTVRIKDCAPLPTLFNIAITNLQNVTVSVFIVGTNGVYATTESAIDTMIGGANERLRHAGVRLVRGSVTYTNNPAWFNLTYSAGNMQDLDDLGRVPNPANGLKVFFVDTINGGNATGLNNEYCMIISTSANNTTLAHETGHACDWRDVYVSQGGLNINNAGVVQASYLNPQDWGAGYYAENLQHTALIPRLLMYGVWSTTKGYIPHGSVYGVGRQTRTSPLSIGMVPIGLDAPNFTRQPQHRNQP